MEAFRTFWREHEPLFKHKIVITSVLGSTDVVQYAVGGSFTQWAARAASLAISGGVEVKYVEAVTLANITIDFVEETSFYIGEFYGNWMNELTTDGRTFGYPGSYKKTLYVGMADNSQLTYEGVFPVSIGAAEMSPKGAILTRRIEFSVDRVSIEERS